MEMPTPKQRFEFQSIDKISKCITSNRESISRLEVLRERAEKGEARKIDDIASNVREINGDLHEMMGEMGKRWDQPQIPPLLPPDTVDLDRRTSTEPLIKFTWFPLMKCRRHLEGAKGTMRNLRAKAREENQTDELIDLENEMESLTQIQIELRGKEEAIRELELVARSR